MLCNAEFVTIFEYAQLSDIINVNLSFYKGKNISM